MAYRASNRRECKPQLPADARAAGGSADEDKPQQVLSGVFRSSVGYCIRGTRCSYVSPGVAGGEVSKEILGEISVAGCAEVGPAGCSRCSLCRGDAEGAVDRLLGL